MTFGERLKQLRERANLSRADMGGILNMHPNAYGTYERDEREPNIEKLCKIAETLHVTMDFLLGYTPDEWDKAKKTLENFGYRFHPAKVGERFSKDCFELTNKAGYIIPITDKREISLLVSRAKAESSLIAHSILEAYIEKAFYNLQIKRCMDFGIAPQAERSADNE